MLAVRRSVHRRPAPRVHVGIRSVAWDGDRLVLDGHAYLERVWLPVRWSALRRVVLRPAGGAAPDAAPGSDPQVCAWARPVRRLDITARAGGPPVCYDWSGLRARLDVRPLAAAAGSAALEWEAVVRLATPVAAAGARLGRPEPDGPLRPPHRLVGGAVVAPVWTDDGWLRIRVRRAGAVVTGVRFPPDAPDTVVMDGSWTTGPRRLGLQSDGGEPLPVSVEPGRGDAFTATVVLPGDGNWTLVESPRESVPTWTTAVTDGVLVRSAAGAPGRRLLATSGGHGELLVTRGPAVPLLIAATGDATDAVHGGSGRSRGGIALALDTADAPSSDRLLLRHDDGTAVAVDGGRGLDPRTLRGLHQGRWTVHAPGPDGLLVPVAVRRDALGDRPDDVPAAAPGDHRVEVRAGPDGSLVLVVDAGGDLRDRGPYRRRVNRFRYRFHRLRPLAEVVLVEAWRGRQFSGSPRALLEELRHRRPDLRVVAVVTDHAVEVPDEVERVVRFSREYMRLLARARWVVANDSMVPWYVKRRGSTYLQTWHGTPLKRIGFDVADLRTSNRNYLTEFAADVARWDYLVSPSHFCTRVLPAAFRYTGRVLETGYPQNDVFHRPVEAALRAAAVRERLGLGDRRVLLHAPTWREDLRDERGRYRFELDLDLDLLRRRLGVGWVVLVRGHSVLTGQVHLDEDDAVRNVSRYPEVADLCLVADVLVTDYSSVMFDFANTGRPIVLHVPDLEHYREALRGFYLDLEAEAPGPLVRTTAGLVDALDALDDLKASYAARYARFRDRFCALEDGHAADRLADAVWGRRPSSAD